MLPAPCTDFQRIASSRACGTASATVVSMALLFLIHAALLQKKVFRPDTFAMWIRPAAAGILFFFLFFYISRWNRFAACLISPACYVAILLALGTVKKSEFRLLTDVFLRRKFL